MLPHISLTPAAELAPRIKRLQGLLQASELEGVLCQYDANLFYFAGTTQRSYLYLPVEGDPLLLAQKSFERACFESALDRIVQVQGPKEIPGILSDHGIKPAVLGLELDVLPANLYFSFQRLFPETRLVDASRAIKETRMLKSTYELVQIRAAGEIVRAMVAATPSLLAVGKTELELSGQIYALGRKLGDQGRARMNGINRYITPIHTLTGASGGIPSFFEGLTGGEGTTPAVPAGAGYRQIGRHEPVYIDFAVAKNGYISDVTRTFWIGKPDPRLARAHQVVVEIEQELASALRPGVLAGEIYDLAVEMARKAGLEEYFQGFRQEQVNFIGHGIGLELDELPVLAQGARFPLQEGMVVAIEPTFVFPGEGAVGVEDSFVITKDGGLNLTPMEYDFVLPDPE